MATLGIASREFSLNEIGNALTVPIDSIGYDCEFGSDGREVDRGHNFTLGATSSRALRKAPRSRWSPLGNLSCCDPSPRPRRSVSDGGIPLSSGGRRHPAEHQ